MSHIKLSDNPVATSMPNIGALCLTTKKDDMQKDLAIALQCCD